MRQLRLEAEHGQQQDQKRAAEAERLRQQEQQRAEEAERQRQVEQQKAEQAGRQRQVEQRPAQRRGEKAVQSQRADDAECRLAELTAELARLCALWAAHEGHQSGKLKASKIASFGSVSMAVCSPSKTPFAIGEKSSMSGRERPSLPCQLRTESVVGPVCNRPDCTADNVLNRRAGGGPFVNRRTMYSNGMHGSFR